MVRHFRVGVDESNHGRFPEYYAAVFSEIDSDAKIFPIIPGREPKFSKIRSSHKGLFTKLKGRDYSFLLARRRNYDAFPKPEFIGNVCAGLLNDKLPEDLERLSIYLDGEVSKIKRDFTQGIVSEVYDLHPSQIEVKYGKKLDQRCLIVNLADELAHHLFKKKGRGNMGKNENRRYFLNL